MNIGGWWENVRLAGESAAVNASIIGVTPGYLPLLFRGMVAGRNVTSADINSGAKVAVISEDLARRLGGQSVLGRMLEFSEGPPGEKLRQFEIVGIAPVIAATSMKERPYAVWLPIEKDRPELTVAVRTLKRPQTVLPAIRQAMSEIDRNLPLVDLVTMEEQIAKGLQRERMFATLCAGFGILALGLLRRSELTLDAGLRSTSQCARFAAPNSSGVAKLLALSEDRGPCICIGYGRLIRRGETTCFRPTQLAICEAVP